MNTNNKPKLNFYLTILLLLFSSQLWAELTASLDRNEVELGESFTLRLSLDENSDEQPDFSILQAVFELGQTGRSSSTQILNGTTTTKTSWSIVLYPKSAGTHIIPPLQVGQQRSQTLKVTVKQPDPNAKAQGDLFIELTADRQQAFVQQQIRLTVRLFYAINLRNGNLSEPTADGAIVQVLDQGTNYSTQRAGKNYQVLERKYSIYAENSGPLQIGPITFQGQVDEGNRRQFGFFNQGRPIRKTSPQLTLDIKKIPAQFLDKAWLPATRLQLKQHFSAEPYKVGEPITQTIELIADGLTETQLPELSLPSLDNAKRYQDKTDNQTRKAKDGLMAIKTIKYAIIPSAAGQMEIPEFKLKWYDLNSQSAKTATIPATTLNIAAGELPASNKLPPAIKLEPGVATKPTTNSQAAPSQPPTQVNNNWKIIALIFASLWLFTTAMLLRKIRTTPQLPKATAKKMPTSFDMAAIKALNQATAERTQNTLIQWWNQQFEQQVTNLSQIINQVSNPEARQALEQLQAGLYTKDRSPSTTDWYQLIKQNKLKPKQTPTATTNKLPKLYEK